MKWMIRGVLGVSLLVVGAPRDAHAQGGASIVEAFGLVGAVTDGGDAIFGAGMHFGAGRLIFSPEVGFLTGGEDFTSGGVEFDTSLISIDLNAHYLFPLSANGSVTPYVLGGLGLIRASASAEGQGVDFDESDTDAGLNLGGGARISLGQNWGVRPEVKFLVQDDTSTRFSVAVYYAFGR